MCAYVFTSNNNMYVSFFVEKIWYIYDVRMNIGQTPLLISAWKTQLIEH